MGKKKKALIIEEPEVDEELVEEKEIEEEKEKKEEEQELSPIDKLKQEFGENYNVVVYRLSDDGSEWQRVGKYALSTLDLDRLAEQYNGGKYRLQVLLPNGRYGTQMTVSYATRRNVVDNGKDNFLMKEIESLKSRIEQMMTKEKETTDGMYTALLKMLENEREQNKALFTAIVSGLSNQTNLFQSMQNTFLQALMKQEKNDFLDTLIRAKQSGILPENEKLDLKGLIEIFNSGLSIGKEVGTAISGNPESIESKFFEKIIDLVAERLKASKQEQPTQVVQPQLPQVQIPQVDIKKIELPKEEGIQEMSNQDKAINLEEEIKKYKDNLLEVCVNKLPPKYVIPYIYIQMPVGISEEELINFLKSDKIYEIIPELQEHKEYVESLKNEFIAYLSS